MRQFSAKQNQPAKTSPAALASSSRVMPERTRPPEHDPSQTAAPRSAFDFGRIAVHRQTPNRIQPKLTVGAAGDAFEQEADLVAEQVMRMQKPTARSQGEAGLAERSTVAARVQTKSSDAGGSVGIAAPPIVHDVLRSPGQPLDAATRAFMEPRFGHDFSKVRVHSDAKAAEAATSVGARAFAVGHAVVHGTDQYRPYTDEGRKLLAHELTHVVQQTVGPSGDVLRRKTGDEYVDHGVAAHAMGAFNASTGTYVVPSDKAIYPDKKAAFDTLYSVAQRFGTTVGAIRKLNGMQESEGVKVGQKLKIPPSSSGAKSPSTVEETLGKEISKGMHIANTPGNDIEYPDKEIKGVKYPEGFLDPNYWEPIYEAGARASWSFRLKEGRSASKAIDAIFSGPARLECQSMISAVLARAVKQTIGPELFDINFGAQGEKNQDLVVGTDISEMRLSRLWRMLRSESATSVKDLKPGDWVYFYNCGDYLDVNPGQDWQGENAIYEGNGLFSGFGAGHMTEADMNKKLWEAYNAGLMAKDKITFDDWKTRKNKDGGKVGLDLKTTIRLDPSEIKKMMKPTISISRPTFKG